MGFWNAVREAFALPSLPEQFTAEETEPQPIDRLIVQMMGRGVAPRVGRTEALSVPAVQRGRNLICSISTLPLIQYNAEWRRVRNPLFEQIDPNVANVVTLAYTLEDLLFEAIAWWRIIESAADDYPTKAERLEPSRVTVQDDKIYVDGRETPAARLIRFDSPNPALLVVGGRAIRRALLLDQAASMYADDPRPLDYFTPAEGADPTNDDDVRELLERWREARKERGTAYVPAALKYNSVEQPTPADLQLVELQKRASLDIANSFGLDPEDLGISTTSRTYQNATDRRQDRINDVLSPYMRAITDRLSMADVTKRGHTVCLYLDDYMRADPRTRWDVYEKAKNLGATTVEEIRDEEKKPPLPAGAQAMPTEVAASLPASATFADDMPATFTADVPVEQFSVEAETRTITGLALPYGKVAQKGTRRFRFVPGSLRWSDVKRVKLLRDHDYGQPVGVAVELTETPEGLRTKFKVARGPEGDRVLSLAEDKVLDGLSVGVDFSEVDRDPDNAGVYLVRLADLREVSLTAMPAFDDARVSSLAASRDKGELMDPCTTCGQHHAPGVACAVTSPPAEVRPVINPARTASTFVAEPQPYQFDRKGNLRRGTHDFSSDLIAASKGDRAALDRAETFIREQFDVDRTDVTTLNPNRQRPDMYVDQREYKYPVWEAINKGTLADSTPFTFPKFNTSSGLVANHTEGVEPTPGAFTATSQTITPTAVSGKVEITRETWDQGGNPQVSNLIWRQMVRAYFEALEAYAVATLDAATPTGITLTPGGGTTGQTLDSELTAAFAALQFIRGGFSMDTMFTQIDLYKALVAAKDTAGRRLYPAIGPVNASGTVRSRFAAIDVNGVTALPAWALAATGIVAASSYLFDSESVHGWATAPQRLDFQYRVAYVDLAIWGYKAAGISDINGVREVIYDPA